MDILQCKWITLLNVTLTVLVAYRSWEKSNYKLVKFLKQRGKSHRVIVKRLVSGARLWGKVSDLPGLPFLICGKRSHSIGRIKWINTKCSKNQTANILLLWDSQYSGFILQACINCGYHFFVNFWKALGNQKRVYSSYKKINETENLDLKRTNWVW